jgi:hypothetical protein
MRIIVDVTLADSEMVLHESRIRHSGAAFTLTRIHCLFAGQLCRFAFCLSATPKVPIRRVEASQGQLVIRLGLLALDVTIRSGEWQHPAPELAAQAPGVAIPIAADSAVPPRYWIVPAVVADEQSPLLAFSMAIRRALRRYIPCSGIALNRRP